MFDKLKKRGGKGMGPAGPPGPYPCHPMSWDILAEYFIVNAL